MEPLVQLAIMWCGVFIASVLADKTKLTSVLYFLAFGTVMVNTGFLPTETSPFIRGFADIGIILIMFALGFEENTRNFLRSIRRSWSIAFFGGAAPFLVAYLVADWFWNDRSIAIMSGLTMTATAVSLTMVSLRNLGLQTSRAAMGIMTSAVLDDIASLALVAVLVPIATGASVVSVPAIAWIIGKAVLFFIGIAVLGAYLLPHDLKGWIARVPLIGRYGLRDLLAAGQGEHSTLTVLLIALVIGLVAHALGFHPAVGAYMAGLILREEYFRFDPKAARRLFKKTKTIVDNAAFSWIGPIFFVDLGTKVILDWDIFVDVIPETLVMSAALLIAQIASAGLAARYIGRFSYHESVLIGLGMLGRAELAFVVMDIAYVQHSIMTTPVFYTLMFTTFILNIAVPVTIGWWKPYYDSSLRPVTSE